MFKKLSCLIISILFVFCFINFTGCKPDIDTGTTIVTNEDGSKTTTVTSEKGGSVITTEYKDGSTKKQTNNPDGTVVIETNNADGSKVTVTMDATGNSVTVTTDKDGKTTTVKVEKKADGTTHTITEKSDGTKTEVILDADGNVVKGESDENNGQPEDTTPDNTTSEDNTTGADTETNPKVTYEDGVAVIEIKNEDGTSVKITLDSAGNSETETKDAEGNVTTVKSEKQTDGSTITTTENPDGTKNVVKTASDGSLIEEPKKGERALPVIRITTTDPKDPDNPLAFVTEPIANSVKIHSTTGENSWGFHYLSMPSPWYEECKVTVEDEYQLPLITEAKAQVKARGNYTTTYDKKGLRIKFNKKKSVLGMHDGKEFKNWVLVACWKDYSLMRDYTAYKLAHMMNSKYYATDCKFVEVYINDNYWGVYLLVEQQESKRVDITDAQEDDGIVETGYLLEYDSYAGVVNGYSIDDQPLGEDGFSIGSYGDFKDLNLEQVTYANPWYTIKSDYDAQKKEFITNYMAKLWEICREAVENHNYLEFKGDNKTLIASSATTAEKCISKVLDIDSLVDTFIMQEIACDLDLHWSSFYMDLDLNPANPKRLTFEAPWDFDSAFGNHKERQIGPEGISHLVSVTSNSPCDGNPWTIIFSKEEWFQNKVRAKWAEMKTSDIKGKLIKEINAIADDSVYANAFLRNYYKWGHAHIDELPSSVQNCKTQKQASAVIVDFLNKRFGMLDNDFANFQSSNKAVTNIDSTVFEDNYNGTYTETLYVEAKEDGLHIKKVHGENWAHTNICVKNENTGKKMAEMNDLDSSTNEVVYPFVEAGSIYSVWLIQMDTGWSGWHSTESKKCRVKAKGGLGELWIEYDSSSFDKNKKELTLKNLTLSKGLDDWSDYLSYYDSTIFDGVVWGEERDGITRKNNRIEKKSNDVYFIDDSYTEGEETKYLWDGKFSGSIALNFMYKYEERMYKLPTFEGYLFQ